MALLDAIFQEEYQGARSAFAATGVWKRGIRYPAGTILFYQGGSWLANTQNINSSPSIAKPIWTLVSGSELHTDIIITPASAVSYPFNARGNDITAVDQGTRTFTLTRSTVGLLAGDLIGVSGSTGNDAIYTLAVNASGFDVQTVEPIPDATANGSVLTQGVLIPAPGLGKQIVSWKWVGTVGPGIAWTTDLNVNAVYAPLTGQGTTDLSSFGIPTHSLDLSTNSPIGYRVAGNEDFGTAVPAVNTALSCFTTQDPTTLVGAGTRSVRWRLYYTIEDASDPTP